MELHEDRNNASTTQPTPPKSIGYACVALAKNRLGGLCIPKAENDRSMPRLRDEDHNDYDQEQCDQTDGYRPVGLLHILNDEIREGIELLIGHTIIATTTRELILSLLKGDLEAINPGAIVFRNQP